MAAAGLSELREALQAAGYRVIGPRVSGAAIVLGELTSARELPFGWGVTLAPGGYRLRQRDDGAAFGHSAGPGSWKEFPHPRRELLWSATRTDDGTGFEAEPEPEQPQDRLAFLGVRPCDLRDPDPGPGAWLSCSSGLWLSRHVSC